MLVGGATALAALDGALGTRSYDATLTFLCGFGGASAAGPASDGELALPVLGAVALSKLAFSSSGGADVIKVLVSSSAGGGGVIDDIVPPIDSSGGGGGVMDDMVPPVDSSGGGGVSVRVLARASAPASLGRVRSAASSFASAASAASARAVTSSADDSLSRRSPMRW